MSGEQVLYNRPLPGARLNMGHPISKDIAGCWLFNEQMGLRAMDLSPYGNHGVLNGFPAGGQRSFNGLNFDGVNDYVETTSRDNLNITTGDYTIEAWVYPRNLTGLVYERGLFNADGFLCLLSGNRVYHYVSQAAANQEHLSDSGVIPTANVWYSLFVVRRVAEYGGVIFYINGIRGLGTQTSFTNPVSADRTAKIGIRNDLSTQPFDGLIGLVRIWKRGLSTEEVTALYSSPSKPYGLPMFL